jgi:very-short-patch-repair endonuclease
MGVRPLITRHRIEKQTTINARELRSSMTDAEQRLWRSIRGKEIFSCRFRRQHPIGKYIADFACVEKKLVIELDGGQHQDQFAYDEHRTAFLQAQGWQVLRFWNNDVFENQNGVLASIADALRAPPPSQPSPCKEEGAKSSD